MSTHQQPEIPAELWMLWERDAGGWVETGESEVATCYEVLLSESDAKVYCDYLSAAGLVDAVPVRVK